MDKSKFGRLLDGKDAEDVLRCNELASAGSGKRSREETQELAQLKAHLDGVMFRYLREQEAALDLGTLPDMHKVAFKLSKEIDWLTAALGKDSHDTGFDGVRGLLSDIRQSAGRVFTLAGDISSWDARLHHAESMISAVMTDAFYCFPKTDVAEFTKAHSSIPGYRYTLSGASAILNEARQYLVFLKETLASSRDCLQGQLQIGETL